MHSHKKKWRGRPRQDRPIIDRGTKELQHKRALMLEGNSGQNPGLAESLLGILYGRQLISQPLYEAGRFFGELGYQYEPCLGHQFRQNSSVLTHKRMDGKECTLLWSDEQDERRTIAWNNALKALEQAGEGPYKMVLDVVFYDKDLSLYTTPFPNSVISFVYPLRRGLGTLEAYFKGGLQGGQGKHFDQGSNPARSTSFQPPLREHQFSFLP